MDEFGNPLATRKTLIVSVVRRRALVTKATSATNLTSRPDGPMLRK